jgi:PAS domain S-box-containing protein
LPELRAPDRAPSADATLDTLPCGVLSFEDDGTIVAANATLLAMLGYERGEVEGRHVETLLTMAARIFYQTHLYPLVRLHGRADEIFLLFRHKDGGDVGALLNAAHGEHAGRGVIHCVVLEVRERRKYEDALLRAKQQAEAALAALAERTRDVEEANERLQQQKLELELQQEQLREQTTELERARTVAEEANRAKSQFLAVMSHELRTPLNAIGGYTQLIELGVHGPVSDGQREALDRIARAQRHLLRLINEVLNLARIESGQVEYSIENVPAAEVIAAVLPMLEPQMAAAGLRSAATAQPGLVARADREKVQQILINLLTNAVKFTPSGGMVSVVAERDDENRVRMSISDTGIGIAPEHLDRVFERFVQVDVSHAGRKEGSGLGLAISRDLARGMGGDLVAGSEVGRGSTFTLVLPGA